MALTLFMSGSLIYLLFLARTLQPIFHLPMLKVRIPALVLMVIEKMIGFVSFDLLENPWELGIDSIITFEEISEDKINEIITLQE